MLKLKIGDKVRVKSTLEEGLKYGIESVESGMLDLRGKICTIERCRGEQKYTLVEDSGNWSWTKEMFEEVEKPETVIKDFIYHASKMTFTETDVKTQEQKTDSFMLKTKKERVIHNENATIVILDDGTKGVARCNPEDEYNRLKGIKIAFNRAKIKLLQKELKELTK